jgi:glucans biosynthesis protein C
MTVSPSAGGIILAILGFGMRHLTKCTPILQYANEAVLPFYVMHQTVLLSVGFFVVQTQLPDLLKWVVIAVISFSIIMGLYEFLIRRFTLLRFLFGMKLMQTAPSTAGQPAPAASGR